MPDGGILVTERPGRVRRVNAQGQLEAELEENFKPDDYAAISTLENTPKVALPVNIQHATTDESVPFEWGERLAEKLKQEGKAVNFYSYPGDNHDMAGNWSKALIQDIELFRAN